MSERSAEIDRSRCNDRCWGESCVHVAGAPEIPTITVGMTAQECHEEVTREDRAEPCDLPAVAHRLDEEGEPYPVCVRHVREPMVPLFAEVWNDPHLAIKPTRSGPGRLIKGVHR